MSEQQRRDSLAEQAAAWVPPWERPAPPPNPEPDPTSEPPEPPVDGEDDPILDSYRSSGTETVQDPAVAGGPAGQDEAAGRSRPEAREAAAEGVPAARAAGEDGAGGVPRKQPAGRRRATPPPEPGPVLDDAELRGALEAILLVVDEPVSELTLAQVLEQAPERIGPALAGIAAGYTAAGHGFELRRAAGGWRLYTRPEYASYVERFVLDGQSVRLTQAALETLAVIAYKQPVTRSRISAIRGVNCDGVIRTLVSRGLVEECGTEADSGAFLYRTTTMFLEKLGLDSVADLPPLAPFLPDDVEELADAT
ncbi:SMC-Scp complex subunit ScpB [Micromonospora sp. PLK6-60]|uniref:SMC-Scp complex subunit ScpB n=1 Tax=Micromonospora sp. PLK6-60 TaxID=2873383 RepID=UPI001CA63226|nr:SMC-Scp complex subunit ScpB [Micromonospora sp. PLK6-60]MBY8874489.1 SMC-Scp complex subunit ScpB [Micromonospora sp. PLK6-60]